MNISFDLISDLHLLQDDFDWSGQATSQFCVVCGNVSADRAVLKSVLTKLSQCYVLVMYVDGNLEFSHDLQNIEQDYRKFKRQISGIKNFNYLYDNILVLNDVAFVGANGWWNFDFAAPQDTNEVIDWYTQQNLTPSEPDKILEAAMNDVSYLMNSIEKLQRNNQVKKIVVCTHSVPRPDLISHDMELQSDHRIHVLGNQWLNEIRRVDFHKKIHTWVFGHYQNPVDRILEKVRYVNNALAVETSPYLPYYPKKIFID